MARRIVFITHPEVVIDPAIPITAWSLSERGRARMEAAARLPILAGIEAVWCSTERKAREGAGILSHRLGRPLHEHADLGENDRSATGYLPKLEFESVADQFFAHPTQSIRGWERAIDAQARIQRAVAHVTTHHPRAAIVSHGAVGALLLCHLLDETIDRKHDQPGPSGGNYILIEDRRVAQSWTPIGP